MEQQQLSFLKALCEAHTPSGAELPGQRIVAEYVKPYADSVRLDPMGNLHAVVNPDAPFRVMIDAHCDEIGFIVQYIDNDGFIYFQPVGGVNKQIISGERVVIDGPKGRINGVIGRKPIHLMSAKERESGVDKLTDLWIDIGATSRKEAEEVAPLGSFAVVDSAWRDLMGDRVSARAFDDRCGVFVIMEALRRIHGKKLNVACHFVSATQEEVGLLGSKMASYGIDPQLGISVDVTFASDHPTADPKSNGQLSLGAGPVIGVGPNYDPAFVGILRDVAGKANIPLQTQVRARGNGTDGFVMRHTRAGVPVAQLSIALRYMHSAVETISLSDLDQTAELIAQTMLSLSDKPAVGFTL